MPMEGAYTSKFRLQGPNPGSSGIAENGGDKLVHGSGGISQPRAE